MIDLQTGLLLDYYGQFLTAKQREIMTLYFENDYSLSEIAEELGVSRQAVHDTIKKSKKALSDCETRLGLVSRFSERERALKEIADIAEELGKISQKDSIDAGLVREKAEKIQEIIFKIE